MTITRDAATHWADYRQVRRGVIGGGRMEEVLRKGLVWLQALREEVPLGEIEFRHC